MDTKGWLGMPSKRWLGMSNWFWVVFIVVLVLWLAGLYTDFLGGWIHVLLVIALVLLVIWLVQRLKVRKQGS